MRRKCWKKFWENQIKQEFAEGLLPYERTLQASLFGHLRAMGFRVFADPEWFMGRGKPDLVVAWKDREVLLVIELKFTVNGVPYENDVDKLIAWAKIPKLKRPVPCSLTSIPRH